MMLALGMIIFGSITCGALIAALILIQREAQNPIDEFLKTRELEPPKEISRRVL